jgi:hypothetical protein
MADDDLPPAVHALAGFSRQAKLWYTLLAVIFGAGVAVVTFFASFATKTAVEQAVAPVHAQAARAEEKATAAALGLAVQQVVTSNLSSRQEDFARVQLMQGEQLLELAKTSGARPVPALRAAVERAKRDGGPP